MGAGLYFSADQRQMLVHGVSIGIGHDKPGTLAFRGTDGLDKCMPISCAGSLGRRGVSRVWPSVS